MTTDRRRARRLRRRLWDAGFVLACVALAPLVVVSAWLAYADWRIARTETLPREQAAPPGGRWVHAYDTRIHVREWGALQAPPLLLVHGTGAWAGTWEGNVDAMARAGYRVVAIDLPPFGFSELPPGGDYTRVAQARRIEAVMEQLGGRVTLLGHSFGGGPAAEAAMRDPARVEHLVLVDAAIGLQDDPAPPCDPSGMASVLLGWPGLRTSLVAAIGTEPAFTPYLLSQFVSRQEAVTPQRAAIYQVPFRGRDFSSGLGAWANQFATGCESPASAQPPGWRSLALPVSIVWGADDAVTPLPQAQKLQSLLPRARLVVLPGVGHIPQIEDVALFNKSIVEVLKTPPGL